MLKIIIITLLPVFLLAQEISYPDTLYLQSGNNYPCFITEIKTDRLDIQYGDKFTSTIIKLDRISKISVDELGIIYSMESGYREDSALLNQKLKERKTPVSMVDTVSDTLGIEIIRLKDGSEFIGSVTEEDSTAISFRTQAGATVQISKDMIEEREEVTGLTSDGKIIRRDPNQTRLFFAPTARPLKAGEGYFAVYEIFFPMVAIGVTDFFTLSGGLSLIPGLDEQMLYIAPKVTFLNRDVFDVAGGVLYMSVADHNFGIAYGVITLGSQSFAVTGGMGWGFVDGDFSSDPLLVIGLEAQISNSAKLLSENWFIPEVSGGLISFGIRFFGQHLAADFGLVTSTESSEGFPFAPWLGFAYNF